MSTRAVRPKRKPGRPKGPRTSAVVLNLSAREVEALDLVAGTLSKISGRPSDRSRSVAVAVLLSDWTRAREGREAR